VTHWRRWRFVHFQILLLAVLGIVLVSVFLRMPAKSETAGNHPGAVQEGSRSSRENTQGASAHPALAGSAEPNAPDTKTCAMILNRIAQGCALDTYDEMIEAVVALGRLIRESKSRPEVREYLLSRLQLEGNPSLAIGIAASLSVYDSRPDRVIERILTFSDDKLPEAFGLIASLYLGALPAESSAEDERLLWRDIVHFIPGLLPAYDLRFESSGRRRPRSRTSRFCAHSLSMSPAQETLAWLTIPMHWSKSTVPNILISF
jgi:hypothetical protein